MGVGHSAAGVQLSDLAPLLIGQSILSTRPGHWCHGVPLEELTVTPALVNWILVRRNERTCCEF